MNKGFTEAHHLEQYPHTKNHVMMHQWADFRGNTQQFRLFNAAASINLLSTKTHNAIQKILATPHAPKSILFGGMAERYEPMVC